jgi:fimbrial isopeptide formation D2 family protein/LPXTG-motif cell wall-anchored protein
MKRLKRIMALVIAMAMVVAMALPTMAESTATDTGDGTITVTNSSTSVSLDGRTFRAYKVLDVKSVVVDDEDTETPKEYKNVAYTVPANMVPFFTNNTATGLGLTLTGIPTNAPSAALDKAVTDALSAMGDDSAELIAFAEKAKAWCVANNVPYYEATGADSNATSVVFEDLPLGYYLVVDQTAPASGDANIVSSVILDTTTPRQTIVVKANTVPSDKSITGLNTGEDGEENVTRQLYKKDTTGTTDVSDVSIGDIIHYSVDSTVPDTRGYNYYKFVVNDTFDPGLKLDVSTVKVKIGDNEYTNGNGITVTTDPSEVTGATSTTLKIVLNNALEKFTYAEDDEGTYAKVNGEFVTPLPDGYTGTKYSPVTVGTAIKVTYDAELIDGAAVGTKVENKVTIDYTNNPQVDIDNTQDDFKNTDPKGTTPEDRTETYATEITIFKVDENNEPLEGAQFTLTGTSANKVVVKQEKFTEAAASTFEEGQTNFGKTKYWKLADGSYSINDPTTPLEATPTSPMYDLSKYADYQDGDGLTQAAAYTTYVLELINKVTDEENTDQKVVATTDENGVVSFTGLSEGTYIITETVVPDGYNGIDPITATITFEYDSTNDKGTFHCTTLTEDGDNTLSTVIKNQSGVELPSTGGIGTTIFYVVGAILVIGAGVVLITRRRMDV